MQRATTVFYDGDTQRDFLEPDGALYVPAAAPIIPNLARLTRLARAGTPRIRVIGTVCRHFPGDAELTPNGGPYPPHCMDGTRGRECQARWRAAGVELTTTEAVARALG